jgi:D-alanyl-lipoteichoic acid acyltransferase DltB (MBOAT superfamily)
MTEAWAGAGAPQRSLESVGWRKLVTSLLVLFGCGLACAAVVADYYGSEINPSFGLSQTIALTTGLTCVLIGAAAEVKFGIRSLRETLLFWGIVAQATIVTQIIRFYEIESRIFFDVVMYLLLFGFVAHHYLPSRARPPFFVALGAGVIVAMLGAFQPVAALTLIALMLLLSTIAMLPVKLHWRVALLIGATALLAAMQVGWIETGWSNIVVPLVGSIFMFRMIVFLYDTHNGRGPKGFWQRLGYFFLPPNPIFPFFPVVDFATFGRSYYNEDAFVIYQRGVNWIVRGVIHLLIYRFIYQFLTIAPELVSSPGDFLQFLTTNFGLYFRISGLFHLIIGLLLLFGYNLPETHTSFYLSNSFIDFWRRINIYWKDFMQKLFFTPAFTRFKKLGASHLVAVSCAIGVTFLVTWILHSYQWFWMRGTILFTWPDTLFWALLGAFLVLQTWLEDSRQGKRRPTTRGLLGPRGLLVVRTVCTFFTICLLWSFWTSPSVSAWFEMLAQAGLAPVLAPVGETHALAWLTTALTASVVLFLLLITMGFTLGLGSPVTTSMRRKPKKSRVSEALAKGAGVWLLSLGLLAPHFGKAGLPIDAQLALERITGSQLNAQDEAAMTRGYYEDLTNTNRFSPQLWEAMMFRPNNFTPLAHQAGLKIRNDYLEYEYIPGAEFVAHGVMIRINQWGMRDKDYTIETPPNTLRMAIVEASRAVGQGVEQEDGFEARLEQRLNDEYAAPGQAYELLNFSVEGQRPIGRLLTLNEKVWKFEPKVVFYIGGVRDNPVESIAKAFRAGIASPYPVIDDVIARAKLDRAMSVERMTALLAPYRREILGEVYRQFVQSCREHGAIPVWFYLPLLHGVDHLDADPLAMQRQLAQEAGFLMLDISDVYDEHQLEALQIGPWDDVHPNAFGHGLVADALYEKLTQLARDGTLDLRPPAPDSASR